MKKIKLAVVGVGSMGRFHLEAHKKNPEVELYAFCDINEELLKQRGEQYGVERLYTNIDEMLAKLPEIDAVDVVTWNCAHAECSIRALEAGKDVLCEKPMAMNAKEAQQMLDAAKRNGRKLMVGFVRRFGNDSTITKDLIEKGTLGDIYYSKVSYLRRNGCPGGWFCDKKRSGGGPLIDLGVHVIDLAWYLMGMPKPISVSASTFRGLGSGNSTWGGVEYTPAADANSALHDVEDLATGLIRFENGAVMLADASYTMHIENDVNSVALYGTKGGVTIDPDIRLHTKVENYMTNSTFPMSTRFDDFALERELQYFVNAVNNDISLDVFAESGVTMMKILDAMYESSQTGHEVYID